MRGHYFTDEDSARLNRILRDEEDKAKALLDFPQFESTARVCIHGSHVWNGHECGICEDNGIYQWADKP